MYQANHNPYDHIPDTIKVENKIYSMANNSRGGSILFGDKHPIEYIRESKMNQPENVHETEVSPDTTNGGSGSNPEENSILTEGQINSK
jgi:hypothetical protein